MSELAMEVRGVDTDGRTLTGVVAPYDEVSYLTRDPAGERIIRGAFRRSIDHHTKGKKIRLFVGHEEQRAAVGHAVEWIDSADGLSARFVLGPGRRSDEALEDLDNDNFGGLSVAFVPVKAGRGADGVREVREGQLVGVSLVGVPAYAGSRIVARRGVEDLDALLAPFANRPVVDLSPIPAVWLYDSAR